jgi:hypothetical protein
MRRATLLLLATIALAPALGASAPAASTLAGSVRSAFATPAAMNTTASGLRLSEVLFHPAEGQPGFIELLNTGAIGATLDGLTLVNERDQKVALPRGLVPLAAGAVLLIMFDDETRVEDSVLHAAPADFLTLDIGAVALRGADQTLLDAVAWGAGQPEAINLGRGGLSALPGELDPGTTIGRAPETTSLNRFDWTIFSPAEATPGAPNPQPGVTVLLPLSGTILDSPLANLRWYPVPGATAYRVQLTTETDTDFVAPLFDATSPDPSLAVDLLPPGRYLWRVQAIGSSDVPASFSPAQSLEVVTVSAQSAAGVRALPAAVAQGAQTNVLAVRPIAQRKDTKMLLIDRDVVQGGAHAWDGIHPGTDMNDPADRHNCVLAVAAMINAYKGGRLSQDRIGFEIRRDTTSGAEGDLNWNRNLLVGEADEALAFALGVSPGRIDVGVQGPDERDHFWDWVVKEIDADRPMAVLIPDHAVVVAGYDIAPDGARHLLYIDPTGGELNIVPLEEFRLFHYYLTPMRANAPSDEPGVAADSDNDGVVDFDETERFHTLPNSKDSDGDKVPDKEEIFASVFDQTYGYANFGIGRPDYDDDTKAMENDKDSDDYGGGTAGMGGCPDGIEDANYDGKQNGAETSNFDPFDDRCLHAKQVIDHTTDWTYGPDADGITVVWSGGGQIVLDVWVTDVGEGRLEGTATYGGQITNGIEREAPACGSQSWQHIQTYTGQDLTVSGTRQGNQVELVLAGEVRFTDEGIVNGQGCASEQRAVNMTYAAAEMIPTLTGELVDGRYEDEQVHAHPPPLQGSATVHTLIEQQGQENAGAPVG